MDALRARVRRPEPPLAAGVSLVVTGLVAAIVLGNTLTGPADSSPRPGVTERPGSTGTPRPTGTAIPTPVATGTIVPALGAVPDSQGWKPVAWSPDGSTLLVRHGALGFGLLRTNGRIEPLDAERATWWPGAERTLSIVTATIDGQMNLELRAVDADDARTLVRQPEIRSVAWTPDGESFAVAGPNGVLLGSSRGNASPVTTTAAWAVTIAPDGAQVAYVVAEGERAGALVLVDVTRRETQTPESVRLSELDMLAWSPNGRFLAFTQTDPGRAGLYLIAPSLPRSPTRVLSGGFYPGSVSWSPDGRFLAASHSDVDENVASIRVRPDVARVERLGPGQVTAWSPNADALLTVDPTGRLLAYAIGAEASVDSWGSPSPSPPRVLATDGDPTCAPAWSARGLIAYCNALGGVTLVQ